MTSGPDDDVRSIDVGDGIVVHVPAPGADLAPTVARSPPVWSVGPAPGALAGGVALLALLRLGFTAHGILAAAVLAVLTLLSAIDLRWRLLPNRIVLPTTAVVLAWQFAFFPSRSAEWVLAAAGGAAVLLLPSLMSPGAIGMGDVKLGALLGASLGAGVIAALMLGFLAVVPAAVVLLARHGAAARRATLPLGPFLAFGAAVVLLA
jgi:leader peptidase (prepilin peptidase) / N-methyltransferase